MKYLLVKLFESRKHNNEQSHVPAATPRPCRAVGRRAATTVRRRLRCACMQACIQMQGLLEKRRRRLRPVTFGAAPALPLYTRTHTRAAEASHDTAALEIASAIIYVIGLIDNKSIKRVSY